MDNPQTYDDYLEDHYRKFIIEIDDLKIVMSCPMGYKLWCEYNKLTLDLL